MSLELDKIKNTNLLNENDLDVITKLSDELKNTFNKKEMFRSEYLARTSVLNNLKFPDPASKYWQSVREQDTMLTNLVMDSFLYEKTLAEIEILECEKNEIEPKDKKSNAKRKIKQIEINEKKFSLINLQLNSHHRVREIAMWEKIKDEQIKIDPTFDRQNVENSQRKSFEKRWQKEKNIAMKINNGELFKN